MRSLFAVLAALVLVVAPAAQANACMCAEIAATPAQQSCCAGPGGTCCGCCGEERPGDAFGKRCSCTTQEPQATDAPAAALPAMEISDTVAPPAPTLQRRVDTPRVERKTPHPEVVLPLLV